MDSYSELIWIVGIIVVIVIGLILGKRIRVDLNNKGFNLFVFKNAKKSNNISIEGDDSTVLQDVNNINEKKKSVDNRVKIKGNKNKIFQDVNNKNK